MRNPLAATGGIDPEDMQHIRQFAPFAYAAAAAVRHRGRLRGGRPRGRGVIADARGTLRWTGSWYTAFVSIEPAEQRPGQLASGPQATLEMLRMMGTDIAVEGAVIVGLRIEMEICVDAGLPAAAVHRR